MPSPRSYISRCAAVLLFLLVLGSASPAAAREIHGRVVGITDGDTLTLFTELRQQVRVRLAGIDAPERRQPFGDRARQMLAGLTFERRARVIVTSTDRNGRLIGRLFVRSRDINAEMVRRGGAWVFLRYSSDAELLQLEAEARAARRGLWALPEAQRVPPWELRERSRQAR
jgi:endonuclease YncB( thermonuclease family)